MLKSVFSLFLMLMVNAFIFANAILPHHHHQGIPHFILNAGTAEKHTHDEDACCCHHSEEPEDSCVFDNDIDFLVYEEDGYSVDLQKNIVRQVWLFHGLLFTVEFDLSPESYSDTSPPYLIQYTDQYVNASQGLRAPPFVS